MDEITIWGNAAAVPIVIAITQFLKKNFQFKRKADVISFLVAFIVCWGWEIYNISAKDLYILWGNDIISWSKHFIELMIISFATWLSASKSYDLFLGDKKKAKEHAFDKKILQLEINELSERLNGNGGENEKKEEEERPVAEAESLDARLREILDGE